MTHVLSQEPCDIFPVVVDDRPLAGKQLEGVLNQKEISGLAITVLFL